MAVLLFHGEVTGAKGGFLGVTAFFVLSGFLIGSLLLAEREQSGRIDLAAFWVRRARRLAPAALVLIAVVIACLAWGSGQPAPGVVGDGIASATWMANWRFVFSGQSYAALFSDPSPFQHMWSLAVEEQFYLLFPLAAVALRTRRRFAGAVAVAIAASTALTVVLPTARAYYGTDTRAAEPLIGVLLAVALLGRRPSRRRRVLLELTGIVGLCGLVAMVLTVPEGSALLSRGAFLLAAALAAGVVASVTEPRTLVARALATPPMIALGRISYGVYLYHWPVFLVFDEAATGLRPAPLFAVRCATTLALATLSYFLVEQPIRHGRLRVRIGLVGWANATVGLLAGLVLVASATPTGSTSLLASAPTAAAPPLPPEVTTTLPPTTVAAPDPAELRTTTTTTVGTRRPTKAALRPEPVGSSKSAAPPAAPSPVPSQDPAPNGPPPLKIAVVGDSMAEDLAKGLAAWAGGRSDVVVYDLTTRGCPLSRGGGTRRFPHGAEWGVEKVCDWWGDPATDRSRRFAQFDPDAVVMHDALNEAVDRKLPEWPGFRRPGDAYFDQWLLGEYTAAIARFGELGAKVLTLNPVCADWRTMGGPWQYYDNYDGNSRLSALDRLATRLADGGHLIADLGEKVCPGDRYSTTVAGVDNARPDGYHFRLEAATALAQQWLGPLVLSLAPKPS